MATAVRIVFSTRAMKMNPGCEAQLNQSLRPFEKPRRNGHPEIQTLSKGLPPVGARGA
jgi:hypothetical protein